MVNLKKRKKVDALSQLIKEHPNFILLQLGKITHKQLEDIRKSISGKATFKVIKNSLLEKAFNKFLPTKAVFKDLKKKFLPLKNQNASLFLKNDWFESLKIIDNYLKKDYQLKFKFAVIEEQIYDDISLNKIAALPPKNILIAQVIGNIKAPIYRLYHSLNYPLAKLIFIFKNKKTVNS